MPATTATTSPTPETIASARSRPVALSTRSRPHLSRPPASRSTLPAVSLHRRGHCLPPLGHHGRLYHHSPAPARVLVSTPCHRPHAARMGRAGTALSRTHIPARSPRSGPQCRGNRLFLRPSTHRGMETTRRAPALKGPSTVPLQFRRLPNSRAEAKTDDAPPQIPSRDVILPSPYDSA